MSCCSSRAASVRSAAVDKSGNEPRVWGIFPARPGVSPATLGPTRPVLDLLAAELVQALVSELLWSAALRQSARRADKDKRELETASPKRGVPSVRREGRDRGTPRETKVTLGPLPLRIESGPGFGALWPGLFGLGRVIGSPLRGAVATYSRAT